MSKNDTVKTNKGLITMPTQSNSDFYANIERYFPLEKCFLPNPKMDYPEIKIELHKLRQQDTKKLFQTPII